MQNWIRYQVFILSHKSSKKTRKIEILRETHSHFFSARESVKTNRHFHWVLNDNFLFFFIIFKHRSNSFPFNASFLIARLARSDPRNSFSACWPFAFSRAICSNFRLFRHVLISSLDMFKNCINSYHIESEQVSTCLRIIWIVTFSILSLRSILILRSIESEQVYWVLEVFWTSRAILDSILLSLVFEQFQPKFNSQSGHVIKTL